MVFGNGQNPRVEAPVFVVLVDIVVNFQENILGDVRSIVGITGEVQGHIVNSF